MSCLFRNTRSQSDTRHCSVLRQKYSGTGHIPVLGRTSLCLSIRPKFETVHCEVICFHICFIGLENHVLPSFVLVQWPLWNRKLGYSVVIWVLIGDEWDPHSRHELGEALVAWIGPYPIDQGRVGNTKDVSDFIDQNWVVLLPPAPIAYPLFLLRTPLHFFPIAYTFLMYIYEGRSKRRFPLPF